jgi:hypothetical protein
MEISILQKQGRTPLTVLGMDTKWLLCPFFNFKESTCFADTFAIQ